MPDPPPSPHAEYSHRLAARQATLAALEQRDRRIATLRLGVAAAGLVLAWLALGWRWFPAGWLAAPVLVFLAVAIWHERVLQAARRLRRAVAFCEAGLRRLEH